MSTYKCKYSEDCNGCYFKETKIDEDKFKECWDCVPVVYIDSNEPAVPSNYITNFPREHKEN